MLLRRFLWRLPTLRRCRSLCQQTGSSSSSNNGNNSQRGLLAAFDFDKTLVEADCYTELGRLLLPEQRSEPLITLSEQPNWMAYIHLLLELLQLEQGLSAVEIAQHVRRQPPVPGMVSLLRRLGQVQAHMCILSDANSFFIGEWLAAHGVDKVIAAVYTNPARVQADGRLLVEPYESQLHCDYCPENMCKGGIMDMLLSSGDVSFRRAIYVGDSCNDLCPIRYLRPQDIACIRHGEELHQKLPLHQHEINCRVLYWRDGHDLERQLFQDDFCL